MRFLFSPYASRWKALKDQNFYGGGSYEIFGGYLYFYKASNKEELYKESYHKNKTLHQYDSLRANKAALAWGLEA